LHDGGPFGIKQNDSDDRSNASGEGVMFAGYHNIQYVKGITKSQKAETLVFDQLRRSKFYFTVSPSLNMVETGKPSKITLLDVLCLNRIQANPQIEIKGL
jgi:hypothetical protein